MARRLLARSLAMFATGPAAGSTLALFEFFIGSSNSTLAGGLLLGVFDPADELVAGEHGDVVPGCERCGVRSQRLAEVGRKWVHDTTRNVGVAHIFHGNKHTAFMRLAIRRPQCGWRRRLRGVLGTLEPHFQAHSLQEFCRDATNRLVCRRGKPEPHLGRLSALRRGRK